MKVNLSVGAGKTTREYKVLSNARAEIFKIVIRKLYCKLLLFFYKNIIQ